MLEVDPNIQLFKNLPNCVLNDYAISYFLLSVLDFQFLHLLLTFVGKTKTIHFSHSHRCLAVLHCFNSYFPNDLVLRISPVFICHPYVLFSELSVHIFDLLLKELFCNFSYILDISSSFDICFINILSQSMVLVFIS